MRKKEIRIMATELDLITSLIACPSCKGRLAVKQEGLSCNACRKEYAVNNGIISLFPANKQDFEKTQEAYYDEVYDNHDSAKIYDDGIVKNYFYETLNERHFFSLLKRKLIGGEAVLDIGCGGGNIYRHLNVKGVTFFNFDISESALCHARKFTGKEAFLIQGTNYALPFLSNSLNYVVTYGVLHHIDNLTGVLKEIKRVLKPKGEFIAFEPAGRYPWPFLWMDVLHLPGFIRNPLRNLYEKLKKRFHAADPIHSLARCIEKDNFESKKHFFKFLEDYKKLLEPVFGENNTQLKCSLLEFLPPRMFFIKIGVWVRFCLKFSDFLSGSKTLSKHARFIRIESFKNA